MNNPARLFLAAVLLSACALPQTQPEAQAPLKSGGDAQATVEAFDRALGSGDAPAVMALLAPDVLIYESGGQESSREEYAAHHMKSDMAFLASMQRTILGHDSGGDDQNAWVSTRSRIAGRFKDKDIDLLSTESLVLRNTAEGWRIVHIHWSSRPASKDH